MTVVLRFPCVFFWFLSRFVDIFEVIDCGTFARPPVDFGCGLFGLLLLCFPLWLVLLVLLGLWGVNGAPKRPLTVFAPPVPMMLYLVVFRSCASSQTTDKSHPRFVFSHSRVLDLVYVPPHPFAPIRTQEYSL